MNWKNVELPIKCEKVEGIKTINYKTMKKPKKYVMMISRTFPTTHKRKGEPTNFVEKIGYQNKLSEGCEVPCLVCDTHYDSRGKCVKCFEIPKLHTCRGNFERWNRIINEVKAGTAILCLRYWSGKPYWSEQVQFAVFDKYSDIGVQSLHEGILEDFSVKSGNIYREIDVETIAKNDGLSVEDFKEWFKKTDLSESLAVIWFCKQRY